MCVHNSMFNKAGHPAIHLLAYPHTTPPASPSPRLLPYPCPAGTTQHTWQEIVPTRLSLQRGTALLIYRLQAAAHG